MYSFIRSLIFVFLISIPVFSQSFLFLNYQVSPSGMGMGNNSVALYSPGDAFTYNPSQLAYVKGASLSFFHNPFQRVFSFPLNVYTASANFQQLGTFSLEYMRQDLGTLYYLTDIYDLNAVQSVEAYEYSLSLNFAREFSRALSAGISARYARASVSQKYDSFLFSLGLQYHPALFNDRLNIGFSLMNMGVKHDIQIGPNYTSESSPSTINLGIFGIPLENNYMRLGMQYAFSKYLVWHDDNEIYLEDPNNRILSRSGTSSFYALIHDWKDFPNDVNSHTGLSFEWKPLNLGSNFAFFQNFYLGAVFPGSKDIFTSKVFTHGAEAGLIFESFSLSAAYSGWWHFATKDVFPSTMPFEAVQFNLKWNMNGPQITSSASALNKIILSTSAGYNLRGGNMVPSDNAKTKDGMSYSIESAFYTNSNSALVTAFSYTSMPIEFQGVYSFLNSYIDMHLETLGLTSSYRRHLTGTPFYGQAGLGIARLKARLKSGVDDYSSEYFYQTTFNAAAGALLGIPGTNLVITPEINYQLMLVPMHHIDKAPYLGGENQLGLTLKAGYLLN